MTKGPGPKQWAATASRKTSLRSIKRALAKKARKDPELRKKLDDLQK